MLLHCTASYPCAFEELNLSYITRLRALFPQTLIGWSGHDNGIAMALVAYAQGARFVEKHVTLNRAMKGTDHAFSLEHSGLERLCRDLARAHVAMGDGVKRYYASERKPIAKMRRRVTADGAADYGGDAGRLKTPRRQAGARDGLSTGGSGRCGWRRCGDGGASVVRHRPDGLRPSATSRRSMGCRRRRLPTSTSS